MTGVVGLFVTVGGAVPWVITLLRRGPVSLRQLIVVDVTLGARRATICLSCPLIRPLR